MQKVMIIGRLARDPETRTPKSGSPICSFSVPVSEKRGEQEHTEWFRVKVFGKSAEFCQKYLAKGRTVFVEGKLQTQKYTGQDGQDRTTTELVAETVQFLDKPESPQRSAQRDMDDMPY